jgi:hypothetical protein
MVVRRLLGLGRHGRGGGGRQHHDGGNESEGEGSATHAELRKLKKTQ